jgi:hypothetical protein
MDSAEMGWGGGDLYSENLVREDIEQFEQAQKSGSLSSLPFTQREKRLAAALHQLQEDFHTAGVMWIAQCRKLENNVKLQRPRLAKLEQFLAIVKRTLAVLPPGTSNDWIRGALSDLESSSKPLPNDYSV